VANNQIKFPAIDRNIVFGSLFFSAFAFKLIAVVALAVLR
jgi:hypothetical protein